jgi:poly(A) polymerase
MRRLDPRAHEWMIAHETVAVMDALTRNRGAARFVGGAVRNALLGLPVTDIDIATPLAPKDVMSRLHAGEIEAHPTGFTHGTITAVSGGKPFEVTSLRRDVAADGRRATVSFTRDWAEDAQRRDFTINALYAAQDGEIFDYTDGVGDLEAGRVRFIGDPATRIREDYLRILRLFRFHAWYGKGELDRDALAAVAAEKAGLRILSAERVQKELFRLLEAQDPAPMLKTMAAISVLAEVLPCTVDTVRLERLIRIDCANFFAADAILRLAALVPRQALDQIADRLKLSNADRERLDDLGHAAGKIIPCLSVREVRNLLYRMGAHRFKDRVRLAWADDPEMSSAPRWRILLTVADDWHRPHFPLTGRDVMAEGVPQGPQVGRILAEIEAWWIDSDFPDDRISIRERLKAVVVQAMD